MISSSSSKRVGVGSRDDEDHEYNRLDDDGERNRRHATTPLLSCRNNSGSSEGMRLRATTTTATTTTNHPRQQQQQQQQQQHYNDNDDDGSRSSDTWTPLLVASSVNNNNEEDDDHEDDDQNHDMNVHRILDRNASFYQSRGRWSVERVRHHHRSSSSSSSQYQRRRQRRRRQQQQRQWCCCCCSTTSCWFNYYCCCICRIITTIWKDWIQGDWFHRLAYQTTCIMMIILFVCYTSIVVFFAGIYYIVSITGRHSQIDPLNPDKTTVIAFCDMDINNHMEALYFSLSTMTTIGYGVSDYYFGGCWTPLLLVLWQVCSAIGFQAVAVGLLFQRISRGRKRAKTILFSNKATIQYINGIPHFMFRLGELRNSYHLMQATVRVYCIRHERIPKTIVQVQQQVQQQQLPSSTTRRLPPPPPTRSNRIQSPSTITTTTTTAATATATAGRRSEGLLFSSSGHHDHHDSTQSGGSHNEITTSTATPAAITPAATATDNNGTMDQKLPPPPSNIQQPHQSQQQQQQQQQQSHPNSNPIPIQTTHFVTRHVKLLHPDEEACGSHILMTLPQVVVHRMDKTSPLVPSRPIWYDQYGIAHHHSASTSSSSSSPPSSSSLSPSSLPPSLPDGTTTTTTTTTSAIPRGDTKEDQHHHQLLQQQVRHHHHHHHEQQVQDMKDFLMDRDVEIIVLVEGTDEGTGAPAQARHSYKPCDLAWDHTFGPCVYPNTTTTTTTGGGGGSSGPVLTIDVAHFHDIEPTPINCDACPYVPDTFV